MDRILVIWQSLPDNTRAYILTPDSTEDYQNILKAHNKYLNIGMGVDLNPVYYVRARIANLIPIFDDSDNKPPYFTDVPVILVITGEMI